MQPIDVSPGDLETVQRILQEHVPELEVRAFGSRVSWTARETSDLDLALMTTQPLDLLCVAEMREAFDESDLPFRVDLVDWASTSKNFRKVIEREYVTIAEGKDRSESGIWPTVVLGDCVTINDSTYSPKEAWPFINYLDTGNVTGNRISEIQQLIAGHNTIPSRARRKVQLGDIVYSTVRPDQRHFGLLKEVPENFLASTGFAVIRGKDGLAFTDFIYWFLTQDHIVDHLHTIAEHSVSAYPSIRPSDIERLVLRLPPLPEQRAIAHVLGTLDDKIEQNRRMNETLETMAQALFKSWFIDFDPVHAKATLKQQAASKITPPLRGSRQAKGASPQARRWGVIRRGYTQRTLTTAQTLRRNRTDAEGLLWHYLRNNQLDGHRFRRQHPIGTYIVDFACLARKVLIELDGSQHAERQADDKKRDAFLRAQGYRVLRFWNNEIFENCFGVLERIYETVTENPPPQPPAPDGLTAPTPPQGGSDWTVERARAYLDGMSPEIAALFPDRFDDATGMPERWETNTIENYLDLAYGKSLPAKTRRPGEVPVYGSGGFAGFHDEALIDGPAVIVGRKGTVGSVYWEDRPVFPIDTVFYVVPKRGTLAFCYQMLLSQPLTDMNTDAAVPGLNRDNVYRLEFPWPGTDLSDAYETLVAPLWRQRSVILKETEILIQTRDALLPKLLSGDLRTNEIAHV